jgi:hypothetical protein
MELALENGPKSKSPSSRSPLAIARLAQPVFFRATDTIELYGSGVARCGLRPSDSRPLSFHASSQYALVPDSSVSFLVPSSVVHLHGRNVLAVRNQLRLSNTDGSRTDQDLAEN